jgi:hypothetical protein
MDRPTPGSVGGPLSARRVATALVVVLAVAGRLAWYLEVLGMSTSRSPANALMVMSPYVYQGTWVFDDPRAGLVREPFVAGVPEMIDTLVADIPNAKLGFRLTFSARPFPGYQQKLMWAREDSGGNYYRLDDPPMEGWLCPALLEYFAAAPAEVYVKAEPIETRR